MLFATSWLLAAVIAFATVERSARLRVPAQALAFALCTFGVLLRPNALIAAPILGAYIAWPTQISWKRTALLFIPAMAGFFALVQVVYYGVLGATRQHPLQSIMVFDLGGISHFTKQNQFPVTWSEPEATLLSERLLPANRVGHLLAARALRFRDAQGRAGGRAVRHAGDHGSLGACGIASSGGLSQASHGVHVEFPRRQQPHHVGCRRRAPARDRVPGSPRAFVALVARARQAQSRRRCSGQARGSSSAWSVCGLAWRRRETPGRRLRPRLFADRPPSICSPIFAVGVASDFRFGYWAVLSGIAGGVVATLADPSLKCPERSPGARQSGS